jgi:CRISPR-associated protein Cas1
VLSLGKKTQNFDFSTPKFTLNRQDSDKIRQKIDKISYVNWQNMGFSKGTLHYMKKNSKAEKPFTMNKHVRERLNEWEYVIDATI